MDIILAILILILGFCCLAIAILGIIKKEVPVRGIGLVYFKVVKNEEYQDFDTVSKDSSVLYYYVIILLFLILSIIFLGGAFWGLIN